MSPRVSLSLKAARALCHDPVPGHWSLDELREAIAKAERSSATRRRLAKPKADKKAKKRAATSEVRAAVMARADRLCEHCGSGEREPELDHFRGKARAESIESCWALCSLCHRRKTDNNPSAAYWLREFVAHCTRHGYLAEALEAQGRLAWVESKAVAP